MNNEELDENLPQEQETANNEVKNSNINKNISKKINKKIQERLSKSAKTKAVKSTLLKAIMPVLTYVIIFILIVIIVIGIVMFFITMPGMVIEKIKELAREIGNTIASWFGADTTKQVEDVEIYETLDYLEEMGYDLKGYGFLTDYVGDSDEGVERDDDGKIEDAESQFIASYLVSDNYVYTIKNFNQKASNPIAAIGQHLASLFTLGQTNQFWSRGMIDIWIDGGVIGNKASYYDVYNLGSININIEDKTLEIKRGWFNNSMKYNLDGWTGRYGMPIDFLISVHLATMMPDLAYDMATGFETIIELLLHPVGGGTGGSNTAIGYYKIGDTYKSYDDFEDYATSGFTGSLNSWRISREEAQNIMNDFGIKSPEKCIGTAEIGEDPILPDSNSNISKTISLNYGVWSPQRIGSDGYDNDDEGKKKKQEVVDTYNEMMNTLKGYGLTEEALSNSDLKISISSFEEYRDMLEEQPKDNSGSYMYIEPSRNKKAQIVWITDDDGYESYLAEIELKYNNFDMVNIGAAAAASVNNNATIIYKLTGIWSEERIDEWLKENNIEVAEEARCSETKPDEACAKCRAHIQKIYDYLKKADVADLEIYQPYISRVRNHWYRDVYFVAVAGDEIIDYDYDYESVMKERWTLYETYDSSTPDKEGEYKLYEIGEDGTYKKDGNDYVLFDGTAEDASSKGVKVAKKAKTKKIEDSVDDLSWNNINSVLSAYDIEGATQEDFQAVYPDVTEDDPDYNIKKDIYVAIKTTGAVKQTGEGQRAETNPKIKKMFLQNRYLKYDGSGEIAEIITALRKSIDSDGYYGTIKGEDNKGNKIDYTDKTATVDGKTYKVSDYSGEVSLNQDSLNAFSMLENEHTLDSDYIYRDFKELIVELGYFEKEELTDETPRLLQFLVPQIGSYGYPNRALDKNEHEYGTMIHSKGDILANKKNTLRELLKGIEAATKKGETGNNKKQTQVSQADNELIPKNILEYNNDKSNKLAEIDITTDVDMVNMMTVSAAGEPTKSPEEVSVEEFLEAAAKVHTDLENNGFSYNQGGGDQTNYESALNSGCYVDCSAYVSWVLQEVSIFPKSKKLATGSKAGNDGMFGDEILAEYLLTKEEAGELQPGDIPISDSHVQINGEGNIQYNAGGNESIQNPPDAYVPDFYTYVIRLPFSGSSTSKGDPYEGYLGNEAVVSPVTGILLEYGTYDGKEKDSVTGEEYRTNIDLKYGTGILKATANNQSGTNTQTQKEPESEVPVDKVSYAKILVLDKENYKKIEQKLLNETRWSKSFLSKNGKYRNIDDLNEDQINDKDNPWTDVDKTLYGYKEFAENYEEFGIAGNVVYIEGFSAELPDENFDSEKDLESKIPDGEDLSLSNFEKITTSSFSSGNISNTDDLLDSLYEKDQDYKLASKKATEKLKAENITKESATSSLYVNGLRVIKEGTVIGRTITDRELIVGYRNENYEDYRKSVAQNSNNSGDQEEKVIGNYIRIIMRDLDKTVVENVEDYMKLDTEADDAKVDDDVFIKYLDHYENGSVYEYLYGNASYNSNLAKYITEDKKYFICYSDGLGKDDRNFGFGILHYLGGSYQAVEYYSKVGIKIDDGSYIDVGTSKCPVDKVIEVQKLEIEAKRELVISMIGKENYDKLTKEQQNCLVDIAYQGCSSWGTLKNLLDSGATPEQVVSGWERLTSTKYNNQARADARKKLWLEGKYTDSSGNEIK